MAQLVHKKSGPVRRDQGDESKRTLGRLTATATTEALIYLAARPMRAMLASLGTCLGIVAIVASAGLAASAQAHVNNVFFNLSSNLVTASAPVGADDLALIPLSSSSRVSSLRGVVAEGVEWPILLSATGVTRLPGPANGGGLTSTEAEAVSLGLLQALDAQFDWGRNSPFGRPGFPGILIGSDAAAALGVFGRGPESVVVDGIPLPVVGVVSGVASNPQMLNDVLIPPGMALHLWGPPTQGSSMIVQTQPGSSSVVAKELALDINPINSSSLLVVGGSTQLEIQSQISSALQTLILAIGGLALMIGVLEITAIGTISMNERVSEIGLRRSLGATKREIAMMVLVETACEGLAGGLAGVLGGLAVVVAYGRLEHETAYLSPALLVVGPVLGLVSGMISGSLPAVRASRLLPAEALRR